MDIKTVRVTEISIDKATQVRIPTEETKQGEKGFKARLVFDTASGEKSTSIELVSWRPAGRGRHKIIIQVPQDQEKA